MFNKATLHFSGWDESSEWAELFNHAKDLFDKAVESNAPREPVLVGFDFLDSAGQALEADFSLSKEEKYCIMLTCAQDLIHNQGRVLGRAFRKRLFARTHWIAKQAAQNGILKDVTFLQTDYIFPTSIATHMDTVSHFYKQHLHESGAFEEEAMPMASADELEIAMSVPIEPEPEIMAEEKVVHCPLSSEDFERTFQVPKTANPDTVAAYLDSFLNDKDWDFKTLVCGIFTEDELFMYCDELMSDNLSNAKGRAFSIVPTQDNCEPVLDWMKTHKIGTEHACLVFIHKNGSPKSVLEKNQLKIVSVEKKIAELVSELDVIS